MENKSGLIFEWSPLRIFTTLIGAVFLCEVFVMLSLEYLPKFPGWITTLLDSTLLSILFFPIIYFLVFRPITVHLTKRTQAEERLKASETRYRQIIETAQEGFGEIDLYGRIIFANKRISDMFGYTQEEYIGLNIIEDLLFPADREAFKEKFTQRHSGETSIYEQCYRQKDGKAFWAIVSASPVLNESGVVQGSFAMMTDITNRVQSEQLLQETYQNVESEKNKLVSMIEGMDEGVVFADENLVVTEINSWLLKAVGQTREQVIGKKLESFHPEPVSKKIEDLFERYRKQESTDTFVVNRKLLGLDLLLRVQPIFRNDQFAGAILNVINITDLVKAQRTAEAASRAKSEFLANMSHEIRTPLNAIVGTLELLSDSELTKEQSDFLSMANSSADSLLGVINDILDFSKIEAGKLELNEIDFNLINTVETISDTMARRAQEKGLELLFHVRPDVPVVLKGDPGRLRQILINLLGNAVKFTQQGEIILEIRTVSAKDEKAVLKFSVSDTGIGIPKEKLEHVFESFSQADGSTSRNYGGTGLGLTISRQLVELMGGSLTIESEQGKGSTFSFTVRFDLGSAKELIVTDTVISLEGLPVLVIDDNDTNRLILHDCCLSWGMRVVEAASGKEGLVKIREARTGQDDFRLVLLDRHMPEQDGFYVAEKIKEEFELEKMTIMMLTSGGQRGDAARCRDIGIAGYLVKPIKQSELYNAVVSVLSGTAMENRKSLVTRHTIREDLSRLHILLVEDHPFNRKIALAILQKRGLAAKICKNGKEAVETLQKGDFDLVLMDIQMPIMDGYQATGAIREREKTTGEHIPIIAMTAHALTGDREKCIQAGMDDYITKPIKPDILIKKIGKWAKAKISSPEKLTPPAGRDDSDLKPLFEKYETDMDFLRELAEMYIDITPEELDSIEKALNERNFEKIEKVAHSAKGAAMNFGLEKLGDLFFALEKAGKKNDFDAATDSLNKARTLYNPIESSLKRFLSEPKS